MMPREQRPVGAGYYRSEELNVTIVRRGQRFQGLTMEGERHVLLARSPDPRLYTDLRCRQAPTVGAPDCRSGRNSTAHPSLPFS